MIGISLCLIVVSFNLPLQFFPWQTISAEACSIWACLLSLIAIGLHSKKSNYKIKVPVGVGFLSCVFVIVVLIDWLTGRLFFKGDATLSIVYILLISLSAIIGFCIDDCFSSREVTSTGDQYSKALVWMCCAVMVGATLSASVAIRQVLAPHLDTLYILRPFQGLDPGRAVGNFGQPNHLASLLGMAIIASWVLFETKAINKTLLVVFWTLFAIALALSGSRTGALSVFIFCSVVIGLMVFQKYRTSWVAFVALIVSIIAFFAIHRHWISATFESGPKSLTVTHARIEIWNSLFPALLDRPLQGWGLLSTVKAQASFVQNPTILQPTGYAHGLWLDLPLWIGLPMSFFLLIFTGYLTIKAIRSNFRISVFALFLILPVFVHSGLEFPFAYAYFLTPVAFFFGIAMSTRANWRTITVSWHWPMGIGVLGLIFSIFAIQQYIVISKHIEHRRFVEFGVGELAPPIPAEHALLWDQLEAFAVAIQDAPRRGLSESELAAESAVRMRFPTRGLMVRYPMVLAINGRLELARKHMDIAATIAPSRWPQAVIDWCHAARTTMPEVGAVLAIKPEIKCKPLSDN